MDEVVVRLPSLLVPLALASSSIPVALTDSLSESDLVVLGRVATHYSEDGKSYNEFFEGQSCEWWTIDVTETLRGSAESTRVAVFWGSLDNLDRGNDRLPNPDDGSTVLAILSRVSAGHYRLTDPLRSVYERGATGNLLAGRPFAPIFWGNGSPEAERDTSFDSFIGFLRTLIPAAVTRPSR